MRADIKKLVTFCRFLIHHSQITTDRKSPKSFHRANKCMIIQRVVAQALSKQLETLLELHY
ncbi:MAG TPA: hypothetical protein VMR45_04810 [Patescibacteria group bacterium]|nr:hypothetical protein [Patescibacteria group bacterium]